MVPSLTVTGGADVWSVLAQVMLLTVSAGSFLAGLDGLRVRATRSAELSQPPLEEQPEWKQAA